MGIDISARKQCEKESANAEAKASDGRGSQSALHLYLAREGMAAGLLALSAESPVE